MVSRAQAATAALPAGKEEDEKRLQLKKTRMEETEKLKALIEAEEQQTEAAPPRWTSPTTISIITLPQ